MRKSMNMRIENFEIVIVNEIRKSKRERKRKKTKKKKKKKKKKSTDPQCF
jgi:hypothetical protein